MGINDKDSRITELLNEGLHIYVDQRGYISMHYYTSLQTDADYVSRWLGGNVCKHRQIFDVSVYNRPTLRILCSKIASLEGVREELKVVLRLVSGYCLAVVKQERILFAVEIMARKENKDAPANV